MPGMFGKIENIDEAIEYARGLQSALCCYGTTQGDGRPCDCKYFVGYENAKYTGLSGEKTGCAEARALIEYLEDLKQEKKYMVNRNLDLNITIARVMNRGRVVFNLCTQVHIDNKFVGTTNAEMPYQEFVRVLLVGSTDQELKDLILKIQQECKEREDFWKSEAVETPKGS